MNNRILKIADTLFLLARDKERVGAARIAAAVIYKNRVISFGFNQNKTHPLQSTYGRNSESLFLHAEIDAIKNALRIINIDTLSQCTLLIMRAKNSRAKAEYGLAKPCSGCSNFLDTFKVKRVIYSTNEGEIEFLNEKTSTQ